MKKQVKIVRHPKIENQYKRNRAINGSQENVSTKIIGRKALTFGKNLKEREQKTIEEKGK